MASIGVRCPQREALKFGGVFDSVFVRDIVTRSDSPWFRKGATALGSKPNRRGGRFAQIAVIAKRCGELVKSTEAVSKLREIFRSAARSEDFHNFSVSGRSQGSKKRTK